MTIVACLPFLTARRGRSTLILAYRQTAVVDMGETPHIRDQRTNGGHRAVCASASTERADGRASTAVGDTRAQLKLLTLELQHRS